LFTVSCNNNTSNKKQIALKDEVIEKEGILYYKDSTNKVYTGKIKSKVFGKMIEYDVINGLKNGEFKTYFENGKLEMIGRILNNKNTGHWKYFFSSGMLESEGDFKDDIPNDRWVWYYEMGKIKEEGYFINGKREGEWIAYDSLGTLLEVVSFKNGEKIKNRK